MHDTFGTRALRFGAPYGIIMGVLWPWQWESVTGLFAGALLGLLSGLFAAFVVSRTHARAVLANPPPSGEHLIGHGLSNYRQGFMPVAGIAGWLCVTDARLLFRSQAKRLGARGGEISIPIDEIIEVQPYSQGWIMPTGLRVVTAKGEERFVVEARQEWIEQIRRVLGDPGRPTLSPASGPIR